MKLQSLPGVQSAATVTFLPLSGWRGSRPVIRSGKTIASPAISMWSSITPDYFRTMQIRVLAARIFDKHDKGGSTPVAVVSESLAKRLFPHGDAIGQTVDAAFVTPLQIVGIVGDVHHLGMASELTPEIYVPFAEFPFPLLSAAIRTQGDPMSLARHAENLGLDPRQESGCVVSDAIGGPGLGICFDTASRLASCWEHSRPSPSCWLPSEFMRWFPLAPRNAHRRLGPAGVGR